MNDSSTNTKDTVENTVVDFVKTSEAKEVTAKEAAFLVKEPEDKMCPENIYEELTKQTHDILNILLTPLVQSKITRKKTLKY